MPNTILITGASSGIGKATAKLFADNGWNVIATMRSPEKETELNSLNNITLAQLDVQDVEGLQAKVNELIAQAGVIDVVLNNAGYAISGPLEGTTEAQMVRQFDVNVFGLMRTTQAFLPHFRENKAGTFINVSSMGGKITFPLLSLYHSTKFAVEGFSESLSYELANLGIKIKLVEPGAIATDFGGRSMDFSQPPVNDYQAFAERVTASWSEATFSQPELVAEVIYNAATDGTDQIRYIAGADAEQLINQRQTAGDEAYISALKEMYSA